MSEHRLPRVLGFMGAWLAILIALLVGSQLSKFRYKARLDRIHCHLSGGFAAGEYCVGKGSALILLKYSGGR